MNTTTLTDRYVDAAMRTVPDKQRDDLGAELRASIDDQIEARVDGGEPHDAAERAVLTELGDPDKLAAGYTDRPLHLIGPRYYLDWWRLLKLLLLIVLPAAAFGIGLAQTLAGQPIGSIIGSLITTLLSVAVNLCFWTTLVFAVIEESSRLSCSREMFSSSDDASFACALSSSSDSSAISRCPERVRGAL